MDTYLIGVRLKALRAEQGLSQNDLAQLFGFKDRQTVSAIETGMRRMTATELMLAVEKLGAPLEYFTDPFRLVGEGRFSWRQTGVGGRPARRVRARRGSVDLGVPCAGTESWARFAAHAAGPRADPLLAS